MRSVVVAFAIASSAVLLGGCSGSDSGITQPLPPGPPPGPPPPAPNPSLGQLAFERECSSCHAAKDAFDLAFFGYSDTTIIRRAVKHVDSSTARLIAAYVRTLNTSHAPENLKLFQPGGSLVSSDVAFAVELLGQDAWPSSMTASQLRAINPLSVRIALPLLIWSDETSNLDWMPDDSLPPAILSYAGNAAASALANYNASPSVQNLTTAVAAIKEADHASANTGAPCVFFVPSRVNYEQCFEVRRWASSLVAQHMLRNGIGQGIGALLHNVWWGVGDVARRSRGQAGAIANAVPNWARWMYVGWMFDPGRISAVYTVGGLRDSGLPRHGTFVALRSLVARPAGSFSEDLSPYDDFKELGAIVPPSWAYAASNLALRNLLDRLNSGDRPPAGSTTTISIDKVNAGMAGISGKVSSAEFATLRSLADQVIAKLN